MGGHDTTRSTPTFSCLSYWRPKKGLATSPLCRPAQRGVARRGQGAHEFWGGGK